MTIYDESGDISPSQFQFAVEKHFMDSMRVMAQMVRNRLESVEAGDHLSASEVEMGVRLSHQEFLRLFELPFRKIELKNKEA